MKNGTGEPADVRNLHSPMALRMLRTLRDLRETWNPIFELLSGPALEQAKRDLTISIRLDESTSRLKQTA